MFIRKTKTATNKDGSPRFSYRLVENTRIDDKVKQKTLLNLGCYFTVEQKHWGVLCQCIEDIMCAQRDLDFICSDPQIHTEAARIAKRLLERRARLSESDPSQKDYQTVDMNSVADCDVRTAGVEHAGIEALTALGVPQLLVDLGLNRRQRCCAIATIVARMAAPASERATNRWLRKTSALGEMLGIDFSALSDMALYRASDKLLLNQRRIEQHLFEKASKLFNFQPTIAFYDLTNTYFEGQMNKMPDAKRGRSKEKRSDCPLLTLALVVDGSGFVVKTRVFAGNVAECKTLEQMIDQLGGDANAVVVMDRGVADDKNLKWLRDNDYRYVVVSRESKRQFDSDDAQTLVTASKNTVSFYKQIVDHDDKKSDTYQEAYLRCHSDSRAHKETGIVDRFKKQFEEGLGEINDSLSKPNTHKKLQTIERRIGKLQKQNSRVARHYKVEVHADKTATKAQRLSWQFDPVDGTMVTHPGVYCLRSNIVEWDAQRMWQTYMTLTEVEAVFRSLKSELGLRPVYHQKQHRANGHLLISVLAYQAVCVLRTRMKANGCHDSWTTVRNELGNLTRTTTTFKRKDDRTLHVRKTATADADQAALYKAMGIAPPSRNIQKTVV